MFLFAIGVVVGILLCLFWSINEAVSGFRLFHGTERQDALKDALERKLGPKGKIIETDPFMELVEKYDAEGKDMTFEAEDDL